MLNRLVVRMSAFGSEKDIYNSYQVKCKDVSVRSEKVDIYDSYHIRFEDTRVCSEKDNYDSHHIRCEDIRVQARTQGGGGGGGSPLPMNPPRSFNFRFKNQRHARSLRASTFRNRSQPCFMVHASFIQLSTCKHLH